MEDGAGAKKERFQRDSLSPSLDAGVDGDAVGGVHQISLSLTQKSRLPSRLVSPQISSEQTAWITTPP